MSFQVFKAESLADTYKRLKDPACMNTSTKSIPVLYYLKESISGDALVAVELCQLGAVQDCLQSLLGRKLDPKVTKAVFYMNRLNQL